MKTNTLFVLILFFMPILANAQTEKGKIIISAGSDLSALFGKTTYEYNGKSVMEVQSKSISIHPSLGKFFWKNLALGISFPIENSRNSYDTNYEEQTTYKFTPFLRWYLNSSKVRPYINLDAGLTFTESDSYTSGYQSVNEKFSGSVFDGGFGISAFMTEKIAFDAQFSYSAGSMSNKDNSSLKLKNESFGFLVGFTIIL